jgi:hypothetical protein
MKSADVFPAVIKIAPPGSFKTLEEFSKLDAYPQGTRRLDRCRVVVLGGTLLVAVDSPQGPELVFRDNVDGMISASKGTYDIVTSSGKAMHVKKDTSCGCGSRLRTWDPYRGMMNSDA